MKKISDLRGPQGQSIRFQGHCTSNYSYMKNYGKFGLLVQLAFKRHQFQHFWSSGYGDMVVFVLASAAILAKIGKKGLDTS